MCPYNQTQTEGFTYTYDQFGNRWHENLTAGSGLNIYYTFANGRNQIDGVTYDGAGNMTNSGGFVYNADGKLTSDGAYSLSYDAAGNMVEQKNLSSGSTLDYIFQGTHEITSVDGTGAWARGEVYAQGWHVNTYASGDTFFAHDDQIGTTRVRTNHTGAIAEHCENDPFGTYFLWCGGAWESDVFYTGQLGLDDGMIVFPARSFHSQSGRFMVPDPAGLAAVDPSNPQSWNRYAYVANNPLSFTDPLGLCPIEQPPGSPGTEARILSWCPPPNPFPIPRDGGGGPPPPPSGGGSNGGGTHGSWPGGETTGLPQLPSQPLSLGDLLDFLPGLCSGSGSIGNGFLGTGVGTSSSSSIACLLILLPLPSLAADAVAGDSGGTKGPNVSGESCTRVGGTKPVGFGGCAYQCESGSATDLVYVPLYKIQRACGKSWNSCPAGLRLEIDSIGPFIFQAGVKVVPNSCVGST